MANSDNNAIKFEKINNDLNIIVSNYETLDNATMEDILNKIKVELKDIVRRRKGKDIEDIKAKEVIDDDDENKVDEITDKLKDVAINYDGNDRNASFLVSDEDKHLLTDFKWYNGRDGVSVTIKTKNWVLHRYIWSVKMGNDIKGIKIGHENGNKLDNRRENLFVATAGEISRNRIARSANTTTIYFGVEKIKENFYTVHIRNKTLDLNLYASYDNALSAAWQYNLWIDEHEIKYTPKNDVKEPEGFVPYVGRIYPVGISVNSDNRFRLILKKKKYGTFSTLEKAIKKRDEIMKVLELELEQKENAMFKEIRATEIIRNANNQAIIPIQCKKELKTLIVDDEDYHDLLCLRASSKSTLTISSNAGKVKVDGREMKLHRYLLKYDGSKMVDHINRNGLDNRKENLRIVTSRQNAQNRSSLANSSSKYLGVQWKADNDCWHARIKVDGKSIHLGYFDEEVDAARCRDEATCEHFGEYGNYNFPDEQKMIENKDKPVIKDDQE